MRKFRPSSWQSQARRLGDSLYCGIIDNGDERKVTNFFALGYDFPMSKQRRKYVEQRAAKRVSRLINKLLEKEI